MSDFPRPTPLPVASQDDLEARRLYAYNVRVSYLHGFFEGLALSCFAWNTVMAWFVRDVTDSKAVIAAGSCMLVLGLFFPQLLSAYWIESRRRVKGYIILAALAYALLGLVYVLLAYLMGRIPDAWWILAVLVTALFISGANGLGAPAITTLFGRIVPRDLRGGFLGRRWAVHTVGATLGGLVVYMLLGNLPAPHNFAVCFMTGSVFHLCGTAVFSFTREPDAMSLTRPRRFRQYIRALPRVIWDDHDFRWFLAARLMLAMANVTIFPFITIFVREMLLLHDEPKHAGTFTSLFFGASCLGYLLWGRLGDRHGFRLVIIICVWVHLARIVMLMAPLSMTSAYVIFALSGLCLSAMIVSTQNLLLDFASPAQRPMYIGIANGLRWPFLIGATLVAGWMVDAVSYRSVFWLSGTLGVASLALFYGCMIEPRRRTPPPGPKEE